MLDTASRQKEVFNLDKDFVLWFPCFGTCDWNYNYCWMLIVFLGEHCYKNILGWCKRATSGCCWRSEAWFSGYGKQGSQHNSKVHTSYIIFFQFPPNPAFTVFCHLSSMILGKLFFFWLLEVISKGIRSSSSWVDFDISSVCWIKIWWFVPIGLFYYKIDNWLLKACLVNF